MLGDDHLAVGIDRRLAKKYGLNIEYRVEGMERISYDDGTFDRVVSASVLEHCRAKRHSFAVRA